MKEVKIQKEPCVIIWLEQNERVDKGIKIINNIPQQKFILILERIIKVRNKLSDPLSNDEIKELAVSLNLNIEEVKLALKTLFYIYDRVTKFLFKPSELQKYFSDKLKLKEDKIEELVKQWTLTVKNLFEDRQSIKNVKWNLNLQIASFTNATESIPTATLQLETNSKENITLNLTYNEVLRLYNSLETIQNEIDYVESLNIENKQ